MVGDCSGTHSDVRGRSHVREPELVTVTARSHFGGFRRRFDRADAFCPERGLQKEVRIGKATVKLIDAAGFYRAAREKLREARLCFVDVNYYRERPW